MPNQEIARLRLGSQRLATPSCERPEEVVRWLGAVQAQDYLGARWALGLRMPQASEATVEQAVADGRILRTHVMRPTWHFVAPEDIRWLLALTAPRTHAACASYYRKLELDETVFARCEELLAETLSGGGQLTRPELAAALEQGGVTTDDLRLTFLVIHAELEGVICSGARRGKQHTYALISERAPHARVLERDEALAELTRRYMASHGPASAQDFAWWSGLTLTEVRRGLDIAGAQLERMVVDGRELWHAPAPGAAPQTDQRAHLLPAYDEYTVAYVDRGDLAAEPYARGHGARESSLLNPVLVVDGQIVGQWKRTLKRREVVVELAPFEPLDEAQRQALAAAAERYAAFLGLQLNLIVT